MTTSTEPMISVGTESPKRHQFMLVMVSALLLAGITIVAVLGGLAAGYVGAQRWWSASSQTTITGAIGQIQSAGDLVTLRVPSASWVEQEETSNISVPYAGEVTTRSVKVIYLAQGSCLLATDLKKITVRDVDDQARTATLVLPQPRVIESTVDAKRSRLMSIDSGRLENLSRSDLQKKAIDKVYEQAQSKIRETGESEEIRHMARQNAETVLRGLMQPMGWTVKFEWGK